MAVIYYTSDTHSYLYPESGTSGYGLLSSLFSDGDLVIDGGDVLQGSPLIRYEMQNGVRPLSASLVFNEAGLDFYLPGNHDFNFGGAVLKQFFDELDARIICANLVDKKWGMEISPYEIFTASDGVKILVSAVVTDYVNVWDRGSHLDGLEITDCVEAAVSVFESTRDLDVDFRILVYHGGFENGDCSGLKENRGDELCNIGYDLVLTAHQHRVIPLQEQGKSMTLQSGSRAALAARIVLRRGEPVKASFVKPSGSEMNSKIHRLLYGSRRDAFQQNLCRIIGRVDGVLEDKDKLESALYGSSLAEFINAVQCEFAGCDISACSLFNDPVSLFGEISTGDLLKAYPFANTLVKLSIRAEDLKRVMERSASYFCLIDGSPAISGEFIKDKVEHYNYDYYRGVSYSFDLRKEIGERVVRLEYKGLDLLTRPEFRLDMVINSYRATGTGGYEAYRNASVIRRYSEDVQDYMIGYFMHHQQVKPFKSTDFKVVW